MDVTFLISVIALLILVSLVVSSISYARQKAIAQTRQEIAQHKKVAHEIIQYRDFVLRVDPDYDLLLTLQKHLLMSLERIAERAGDTEFQNALEHENTRYKAYQNQQRENSVSQAVSDDNALAKCKLELGRINKFLNLARNAGTLSAGRHEILTLHIKLLAISIDVESHIHQAKVCAENNDVVLYQAHLKQARDALKKSPTASQEKTQRIRLLTNIINEVKRSNTIVLDAAIFDTSGPISTELSAQPPETDTNNISLGQAQDLDKPPAL